MPFGPALPNGVRTPSTKTTSLTVRGTMALLQGAGWHCCDTLSARSAPCYLWVTKLPSPARPSGEGHTIGGAVGSRRDPDGPAPLPDSFRRTPHGGPAT